ncbi:MAG: HEPN domain-containing protein [Desulfobacterales bacterium]|nr:HEPN domain-containing protein [Desulfobacterales bacterium]
MKQDPQTRELCKYRLQQAEEALSEARLLQNAGHFRGAINRAYYAMFYAIQVLVVYHKAKVSKHSGVISYFDREFVKPGIIDKKFSKWLHRLFDLRQDADYGVFFEPSEDHCKQAIEQAGEFVNRIQSYFENK